MIASLFVVTFKSDAEFLKNLVQSRLPVSCPFLQDDPFLSIEIDGRCFVVADPHRTGARCGPSHQDQTKPFGRQRPPVICRRAEEGVHVTPGHADSNASVIGPRHSRLCGKCEDPNDRDDAQTGYRESPFATDHVRSPRSRLSRGACEALNSVPTTNACGRSGLRNRIRLE